MTFPIPCDVYPDELFEFEDEEMDYDNYGNYEN